MNWSSAFRWEWIIIELLLLLFAIGELISYWRYKRRLRHEQQHSGSAASHLDASPPGARGTEG